METATQTQRFVRKRGTKQVFAYSAPLMSRGDMVYYDGPVPVPADFVIPPQETAMIEARLKALQGKMDPRDRPASGAGFLRKIGTSQVFPFSPSLAARKDMVPYYGTVPVPADFVVPREEVEMLAFMGKPQQSKQDNPMTDESFRPDPLTTDFVPPENTSVAPPSDPTPPDVPSAVITSPDAPVSTASGNEAKMTLIIGAITQLPPDEFSPRTDKPNTAAIERLIGMSVSAQERDQAWDMISKKKPSGAKE